MHLLKTIISEVATVLECLSALQIVNFTISHLFYFRAYFVLSCFATLVSKLKTHNLDVAEVVLCH